MTPAARVQTAIEVLDAVIAAARSQGASADRIIADMFRARRYMGSGDRRAVRELVYAAIRACGPMPVGGRAAMALLARNDADLASLFDGSRHGPGPITADETVASGGLAPDWLLERLAASGITPEGVAALLGRAPLDIRFNRLRGEPGALPLQGAPLDGLDGLRFAHGTAVEQWPAYQSGQIEIQDAGSQAACLAVAARPGETVIDLCAGAGGKTLALASAMDNQGRLIACDADRARLSRLAPRAQRAGASLIETRLLDSGREAVGLQDLFAKADAVLVDAPCTGTGTWRRNPEARWRLTPGTLERITTLQARLLDLAGRLVKPGGRLVFVTCSLLDEEGAQQADAFLARHRAWLAQVPGLPIGRRHGQGIRLEPHADDTDGFFIAQFLAP